MTASTVTTTAFSPRTSQPRQPATAGATPEMGESESMSAGISRFATLFSGGRSRGLVLLDQCHGLVVDVRGNDVAADLGVRHLGGLAPGLGEVGRHGRDLQAALLHGL